MALRDVLYALIKPVIGVETLIFADTNSPRPALPYWTLKVSVQRLIGIDGMGQGVDALGFQAIKGVREATVSLQRLGYGAVDTCMDLRDNLSRITVGEAFQLAKVALYDVGDVQDVPYPLDNSQLEPRATLDIFVRVGSELADQVGTIETVAVDAEYVSNQSTDITDTNPDLSQSITVVL
jgi:hypothetical protein